MAYSVGYPLSSTELAIEFGKATESWSNLYEKLYSGNSYICSSSYIAPGSSGGILVNDNLEVIGITTLGWTNANDEFISGASISAFNFKIYLENINESELITLQDRFHSEKKAFIGYFNEARDDEAKGLTERYVYEDGTVAYIYEWTDEATTSYGTPVVTEERLVVGCDGWIDFTSELYWEGGDRRNVRFYGTYDHKKGFSDFIFEYKYQWGDGSYHTVTCSDINYSPTISLTLNKYVSNSYRHTPTQENIDYAKERFNFIYEWLTSDIARFE